MCGPRVTSLQLPSASLSCLPYRCGERRVFWLPLFDASDCFVASKSRHGWHALPQQRHLATLLRLLWATNWCRLVRARLVCLWRTKSFFAFHFFTVCRIYRPRGASASRITFRFHQESPVGDQQGIIAPAMFSLHVHVSWGQHCQSDTTVEMPPHSLMCLLGVRQCTEGGVDVDIRQVWRLH